jgi:hypothetical protein
MIKPSKKEYCIETQIWADEFNGHSNQLPVMDLDERIRKLEKLLPNQEMLDKYPALAEAYKQYKIIEKIILSGE